MTAPDDFDAKDFDLTVLQVIPALDAGGAERSTVEITRAIVDAGGRALVASAGGRLVRDVEAAGGEVVIMPVQSKNPLTMLANRDRLARLVRDRGVDIVHARSRAPAWSALAAARAEGAAFVATYHGAYRAQNPVKRFYNSAMARADLVIANSQFTADAITSAYSVDPGRLLVIPRGADMAWFDPAAVAPARVARLAEDWGLDRAGDGLIALLPGRITDWKGHLVAVEAIARMARADATGGLSGLGAGFQLIFAGDAQGRDALEASIGRAIDGAGLAGAIRLVGHCDDMPAAYAVADVVLAPSTRPEAFGRTAAEAGAMARTVIAADHGGARETVADGETGFLVAPNDAAALAGALARAAALGPQGRAEMGARARARIGDKFSLAAMCAATIAGYKELSATRYSQPARGAA
ncbi:MAG: glycosyltransferase family 4 protein [Parvularculaceae bacterium]